jgi:biopolymer transport protein ExbB/TolQ
MELLADYKQWTVLMGCRWFVAAKEMWDKEMDAMLQSEALAQIESIMKDGAPAQKLAAAKYLANKEYRKDRSASKGRPQRADIDRAARDLAASDRDLQEDLKRITNTNG